MQQHKQIFPLFFLFLLLSVLIISFIPQVKATTNYEWIQNGGFEDCGGNLVSDAGFESGGFASGWSRTSGPYVDIIGGDVHNGSYAAYFGGGVTGATLTHSFSGLSVGEINTFGFWVKKVSGTHNIAFDIVTSNVTLHYGDLPQPTVWTYIDVYSLLVSQSNSVNITSIYFNQYAAQSGNYEYRIDDVFIGNVGSGQTDFNANTTPWFSAEASDFQGINVAGIAHSGIACVYDGYTDYWQAIIQNINFLDSNMATNLTCYVSGSSVPRTVKLKMNVIYSDRSFSTKTVTVTSNNEYDWKFMNFTDIVLPNKIIIQIQFVLPEQTDYYVHVDDVSLLASVPASQSRFSYTLTPLPINQTGFTFTVYQKTNYIFNGFLYDSNGNPTENGTYTLLTSKGSQSGNVISGVFSFVLTERLGVTDFQESIIIQINSTLTIQLTGIWKFVGGEGIGDGDGGYDSWYSNMVVTYMILFIFLIVPPLIIAFEFAKHDVDPFMGFVGGLCLTVPIAYIVHIIDLWVLFVFVLGLILMVLSKLGVFNRS